MHKFGRRLTTCAVGALALAMLFTASPVNTRTAAQAQAQAVGEAAAQDDERQHGPAEELSSAVERPLGYAPTLRTPKQVAADEAVNRLRPETPRQGRLRLRPTMDEALYESLKAAANNNFAQLKPGADGKGGTADMFGTEPLAPPVLKAVNINGASESGMNPPDPHGAVGLTHYVQVTNSRILRFNKSGGLLSNVSLASFFGYTLKTIFDPRVVYDKASARWIVLAEAFQESATVQRCLIAVSQTSSATGAYFIYRFDINVLDNDDFFDYPQLGFDKNHIIVTANIFGPSTSPGYRESRVYAFPKLTMYAGGVASFFQYRAAFLNVGTIAPPIVLDTSAHAFLLSAPAGGGSTLRLYRLTDASPSPTLTFVGTVTVPSFFVPPDARQLNSCSTQRLDTDLRFQNASTQTGASLFNAHTAAATSTSAFPIPRYYEINTTTRALIRSASFFKSGSSHDFNVSIAANAAKDMVVTWTATEPSLSQHAQVRFAGRRAADPTALGAGTALFGSPTCLKEGAGSVLRWGDYSAVSVDPSNSLLFWVTNQKINSQTVWGTRIARVGF
ncbi:MAG TPA: hypothetical protein VG148_03395 [Pyrinomonadaceae bacterium]|nr:hypothetical protein [Pyrinomonadaceae bacterium]